MLEVIIGFAYIAVFTLCIGSGVLKLLSKWFDLPQTGLTGRIVTGAITLSVAVGWISIFAPIGVVVHIIMLILAGLSAWFSRKEILSCLKKTRSSVGAAEYIVGAAFILLIAFASSRGSFHTDTGIYHAAAIRLYEEYGVVKGIANIQLHYGYNSSYLGFAALFTLSRILPSALHITTGFLMIVFTLDGLYHLKDIRAHKVHLSDAMRIVMILYVFMNLTGAMSPATDYGTNLMTGYFMCAYLSVYERDITKEHKVNMYALLSVYGIFLVTMKLSAAMCVVVVILPLVSLIRQKAVGDILKYIGLGLLSFAFYPIRNVILSGWLFYPFEAIDLFNVEWKVPVEYSLIDSAQIKVWGRYLFDVSKIDMPMREWLPIWWEAQEHYDQMLMYGVILGIILLIMTALVNRRFKADLTVFALMIAANLTVWFVSAPFVRYGLIFLMAVPAITAAYAYDTVTARSKHTLSGYALSGICLLIFICFFARIDHYVMDDLVFVKQNLTKGYYVVQQPFDDPEMGVEYMGDAQIPVYYALGYDEKNSYYTCPSTCYYTMLERSEPMGDTVKDGFKAIDYAQY